MDTNLQRNPAACVLSCKTRRRRVGTWGESIGSGDNLCGAISAHVQLEVKMKISGSDEDFLAELEMAPGPAVSFRPSVKYIRDGDCIEFVARRGRYHAEPLDDLVTVYLSDENGQIVGSFIKNIQDLCRQLTRKYPGFRINAEGGRVRLEHLFLAHFWSEPVPSEMVERTYRELIEVAEETKAEAELSVASGTV